MGIMEELQEIFRVIFDDDSLELSDEMTADDIEEWDSLTHMQLIVEIEKKYQIRFTTAEIKKAANVGEFVEIIKGKIVKE